VYNRGEACHGKVFLTIIRDEINKDELVYDSIGEGNDYMAGDHKGCPLGKTIKTMGICSRFLKADWLL
jgi:hypothetical protein